jgi:ABC-type branched-subunit amino acid transport system substrate-binding protein
VSVRRGSFIRFLFVALAGVASVFVHAAELSPLERRGREIYTRGEGAGEIVALVGDGQTKIAASVVPCGSCHGADGKGRAEGGIVPSDITSASLSISRDDTAQGGRKRGPYTNRSLTRAVSMGIDASGNQLGLTMPRYQMSLGDMNAVLSYLKKLDDVRDPGLTPETIRVGVLLPPRAHLSGVADAVRSVLRAFVDARNAGERLYDRRIELVFCDTDGAPAVRAAAAAAFIAREKPFALVSSFTDGADDELAAVAENNGIPLLATISSHAQSGSARRYVRDLVAGVADQTRALGQFISRRFPDARVVVLHGPDEPSQATAAVAARELQERGIPAVVRDSETPARALRDAGFNTILYAGAPGGLATLVAATRDLAWSPSILVSSALVHPDAVDPSRTTAHVYIALAIGPGDQKPDAVASWQKLSSAGGGSTLHQPAQFAALASAELLIAALQRAGRDLTRDKFLAAIDSITALETGLVPPLTFTPTRHVGSTGAHIVSIQAEGESVVWIDPG